MYYDADSLLSYWGSLGFDPGYYELAAFLPGQYNSLYDAISIDDIKLNHIIPMSNLQLNSNANNIVENEAGQGPEPHGILNSNIEIGGSFEMPLFATSLGYVQNCFARLWAHTGLSVYGTPIPILGKILDYDDDERLATIDNIADFIDCYSAANANQLSIVFLNAQHQYISEGFIHQCYKGKRQILLGDSMPTDAQYIVFLQSFSNQEWGINKPIISPSFYLLTHTYGLLGPCVVDSIQINFPANDILTATVNLKILNIYPQYQHSIKDLVNIIVQDIDVEKVMLPIIGSQMMIQHMVGNNKQYGFSGILGSNQMKGNASSILSTSTINNMTVKINNNIETIFASHSARTFPDNVIENTYACALASNGRQVEGSISILTPLSATMLSQRILGPESLYRADNAGLRIQTGYFDLSLPGIYWQAPSQQVDAQKDHQVTLNWKAHTQKLYEFPPLEYPSFV